MIPSGSGRRELLPLAAAFALVIAVGVGVATLTVSTLSSIRAYLVGEGLYSKAEREAVLHLEGFARSGHETSWQAYLDSIAIPLADARAREALEADPPDTEGAARAFVAARNDPGDVPGMVTLFRYAGAMPAMREAIEVWRQGDAEIARIDGLAREIRASGAAGRAPEQLEGLLHEVRAAGTRVRVLEHRFAETLAGAARALERVILAVAWGAGFLLLAIGFLTSHWIIEDVRRRQHVFRTMIARASDMITLLDRGGRILYNSPALERVLGHPPDALNGRDVFQWVHPDDREGVLRAMQDGLQGLEPKVAFRFRNAGGEWATVEASGTSFPLAAGETGLLVTSRDVTERRELEARLAASQRLESLGRLAGGVAHDFNNLMTAIFGSVAVARAQAEGRADLKEELDVIEESCVRAARLTEQLLTFARRRFGSVEVLDVAEVLGSMKPMLERLVGESVELRMEATGGGAPIEADRSQLEQVLLNLVVNARDAMPAGGTLTLAVAAGVRFATPGEAERRCVRIDVVDTGVAIDPKVLPHIFEPFFTTKHRSAGAGLGLATCYGIVAQAGGHTGVESERGKGTRFTIHWPEAAASAGGARAPAAAATAAGRETVLLVEDEAAVRRISARALADRGYRVIAAADGAEALALGEREGPVDLLVTDVVMPHLGGRELAERLLVRNAALRVLFVSGYTPDDALNERIQTGDAAFLPKPYRPDDLLARVREVLDAPAGSERRA